MKIAIIGSRSLSPDNIGNYIQENDEIVSGGAKGVDACAEEYAKSKGLKLTLLLWTKTCPFKQLFTTATL